MFLLAVLAVYGGFHAYFYTKLRVALPLVPWTNALIVILLLLLFFSPIIVRLAERWGLELFARALAYIGYLWMGFLFLSVVTSLLLDSVGLLTGIARLISTRTNVPLLPAWLQLLAPTLVAFSISVYGWCEAKDVRLHYIEVPSAKILPTAVPLRIVQLSDLHLGLLIREERLRQVLALVHEAQPDILVFTGDLLDGQIDTMAGCAALLREVQPPYGKWAILGNHEYYAGLTSAKTFLQEAGFTLLRGRAAATAGIILAGLDDPTGTGYGTAARKAAAALLTGLPADRFTVLLAHQPIVYKEARGRFDLQLSGHTHKGQIFPFNCITRLFFPYNSGFFRLGGGEYLYVSPGTGTWGPPLRFLAPPEVTVIDLVPAQGST